jgi:hypothetical protein
LTQSFRSHYGPGVDSVSNRNEYQEYSLVGKAGLCLRPTTLPPSCADYLEIWQPQPHGIPRACTGNAFIYIYTHTHTHRVTVNFTKNHERRYLRIAHCISAGQLQRTTLQPRWRTATFFALPVRAWLDNHFTGRWIGSGGRTKWPPRRPDHIPCDFSS